MKKYKLLKDMPAVKAGRIFIQRKDGEGIEIVSPVDNVWSEFHHVDIIQSPDWFEIVNDRFKPERGGKYFIVDVNGASIRVSTWNDDPCDVGRYEWGNVFETQAQAEKAHVRIKRALLDYHLELGDK